MPGLSRSTRTESDVASVNQKKEREMLVKQAWVKKMRLQFCVREEFEVTKDIILEDGTLNQEYFRPPRGTTLQDQASTKKWTESDRALLIQGITKHGIGHFRAISEELLPDWRPNDLRIKTMRLIGRQNLQAYKDWKGDETEIAKEYERNKELGLRFDCWKAGVLVADDDGNVERITFNGWFDKSSADENAAVEAVSSQVGFRVLESIPSRPNHFPAIG
ncbi:hypothetical protein DFS34DRAFT_581366 [Phlyctochytrium arcticum]|nr:hypothetical protein DFS34DRAFT_581366 [Phlyctochytrium arcticum]